MKKTKLQIRSVARQCTPVLASALLMFTLAGCGKDGRDGAPGPQGPAGGEGPPGPSIGPLEGLSITIEKATVNSAPVIDFMVRNQTGQPFAALVPNDLRFTIAKLIPGMPTNWQNYILTNPTSSAAGAPGLGRTTVQGTRETPTGSADPSAGPTFPPGSLVNYGNGRYTYTFATDITQGQANCPDPCKDAFGRTLDLSYNSTLTHRVGIQTRGEVPPVNATFDFVPGGGPVTTRRDIVKTESCNECHDALEAHDARIEVKYCVTCHNLGSTDPDSERPAKDAPAGQPMQVLSSGTVDFKQMIHKIHRGASLPTVAGCNRNPGCVVTQALGGEYAIWGFRNTKHTFAEVIDEDPDPGVEELEARGIHFPQDIRNCTKCHDAADAETPQGGNWNTVPSMEACGSCHENVKFDIAGPAAGGADPNGHPGGIVVDNSECVTCHAAGRIAGSVAESHTILEKVAAASFKYEILKVCGVDVVNGVADTDGALPACQPGGMPTVTFRISDPTGNTSHGYGANYDVRVLAADGGGDPEFASPSSSLNVLMAWDTRDYNNDGGAGSRPARANSVNVRTGGGVMDNTDGTFTVTMPTLPVDPTTDPGFIEPQGTGTVAIEGHPAGPGENGVFELPRCNTATTACDALWGPGNYCDNSPGAGGNANCPTDDVRATVKAAVAYFGITDPDPVPRRQVVDVITKCDRCHDLLSLHGNNRSDEAQLCVMCHNPRNTDIGRRGGVPGIDGKLEEAIDFKRLIHGIHAAAQTNFDGTIAHGFREKGLVIYGFSGNPNDYSHIRFPGELSRCTTCHLPDTYTLADRSAEGGGNWELPAQSNILGSTTDTGPDDALRSDDLSRSPTASVCSACHDGQLAMEHMVSLGGALFGFDQTTIEGNTETCAVCHGPDKLADVEVVHPGEARGVIP